jgi:MATE family multidrug resistance protein
VHPPQNRPDSHTGDPSTAAVPAHESAPRTASASPGTGAARRILGLGLPIFGGMASGALLTLVDTALVGQLGYRELAAVGLGSMAAWIYLGFFAGFTVAVQAIVSRRVGEGAPASEYGVGLNAALILIAIGAPASALLLWWYTPVLFALLNDDPEVLRHGVPYLRWLIAQAPFMGAVYAFNGFWNGVSRSHLYVPALVAMHVANVLLAWGLIFGNFGLPARGAEGAGLATFCASLFGFAIYCVLGWRYGRPLGFLRVRPRRADVAAVLRLAVPVGMQQLLDTLALTLMYRIVGMIGTVELAAYAVLINIVGFVGLPAFALGTAGATLVGESLGARDVEAAARWARDVLLVGACALALLGVPFWLAPDLVLQIFLTDPAALDAARLPMRILGLMIVVNGAGYMLAAMLNGAGDVRRVTWVNMLTQWFWLLPGAWLLGPTLGFGLLGVWCMHQFGFRALQSAIYVLLWRRRGWASVRI